jgi:hypothetical protein
MLERARNYSHRYNLSIYGWQMLWYRIQREYRISTPPGEYSKTVSSAVLSLTFSNLVQLLNYELPTMSDVEILHKEQASVTLPSLGVPVGLVSATLFLEIGLLLAVFYFWIWYTEAAVSENFPAPGTLFGAIARSLLSRLIFLLLIWVPPIAGVWLALKSYWIKPENSIFAAFGIILTLVVLKEAWSLIFKRPFSSIGATISWPYAVHCGVGFSSFFLIRRPFLAKSSA